MIVKSTEEECVCSDSYVIHAIPYLLPYLCTFAVASFQSCLLSYLYPRVFSLHILVLCMLPPSRTPSLRPIYVHSRQHTSLSFMCPISPHPSVYATVFICLSSSSLSHHFYPLSSVSPFVSCVISQFSVHYATTDHLPKDARGVMGGK